ncbi:hypothetical protein AB0F36_05750 [Streptomyces sp. NPDC029080]|uniref:hypothetical protein n=1 Tax=Streptomyces sp. NPDC029080 TaxID=3155017 RepID=UPI0033E8187D
MHLRATVAAVSGAVALSALALPAAHAADGGSSYRAHVAEALAQHAPGRSARTAAAAPVGDLNVSFSGFRISKAIKVGTGARVSPVVTYKLTHGADVDITDPAFLTGPMIYRGRAEDPVNIQGGEAPATCVETSATTATCKGRIDIDPRETGVDVKLRNSQAGTWHGAALAWDVDSDRMSLQFGLGSTLVRRNAVLTANAAPEPVKKGRTLTVTGRLTRADWQDHKYHGYSGQPVKLQFRKKGSSAYTTLKTVRTNSAGSLKTTAKATADGYYRFSFAGTTTTAAVSAAGDFVDVK